jgi:hypothetical protein
MNLTYYHFWNIYLYLVVLIICTGLCARQSLICIELNNNCWQMGSRRCNAVVSLD